MEIDREERIAIRRFMAANAYPFSQAHLFLSFAIKQRIKY
jgi:hypothetical protein